MGKKNRLRQEREKKEAEKKIANREEIDRQTKAETTTLMRLIIESDPDFHEARDLAQANKKREDKEKKSKREETRNLFGRYRGWK